MSYRGPISVIQKPNIKLSDTSIISMKETSQISPFSPTENQFQNLVSMRVKIGQPAVVSENGP